ncbi:hypothetical protein GCM10027299_09620 [Larkinella ripae]
MQIHRANFFNGYRTHFGPLSQQKVVAIDTLIDFIEADTGWTTGDVSIRQLAYTLATFQHETAGTMEPISEYGSENYFNTRYGPHTNVGKQLGNTQEGDGARYKGRGFLMITGRSNYRHMGELFNVDLINNPSLANEPKLSYAISMAGLRTGSFTGKCISNYINEKKTDYFNARRAVNGVDRAELIASYAVKFEQILRVSINVQS